MAGFCEGGNEPTGSLKATNRSSTRVCVRICVSIRRPEFECSGPQLEGPEFECSGPQLEGPEFEYSELSLKVCGSRYHELERNLKCEVWSGLEAVLPSFRLTGCPGHSGLNSLLGFATLSTELKTSSANFEDRTRLET
ncbi:hypothetical protein ANN_23858 [Periplaneta americana]|uniref:Uncharacterized protein n=1 Tax=Periplaneta americana TaxID=6978 RepID=A0ABQ8S1K5_PERAM|nr:hypothetical protein ANN_23858 [Periplaneta americana]